MREPPPSETMHLGPGELWTADKAYVCDGAVLEVQFHPDGAPERRLSRVEVQQLHDINVARHRTPTETREHLRRCLDLLQSRGLLIVRGEEVLVVHGELIEVSPRLTLQAFHRPESGRGPFVIVSDEGDGG